MAKKSKAPKEESYLFYYIMIPVAIFSTLFSILAFILSLLGILYWRG